MLSQMTVLECVQIKWEKHNYLPFIDRYKLVSLIKRILED